MGCPRLRLPWRLLLISVLSGSWRCLLLLLLLLRGRFGLALALRLVGGFVVWRARAFRDLAHNLPGLLVGDRHEAIVAVELLLHRIREAEGEEAVGDLRGEIRLEVVGVGERGGRKDRALVDDAEVLELQRAARHHALE